VRSSHHALQYKFLQIETTNYDKGLELIEKLKLAIDFEIEHQYINAIGKTGDFTSFVRKQSQEALRLFPKSTQWYSALALMERYPLLDLTSRMHACRKLFEILSDLKELYSSQEEVVKAPTVVDAANPNIDITSSHIQYLKGVGPKLAERLAELNIHTVENLLHYLPRKHVSYDDATPIRNLVPDTDATIIGFISRVTAFESPKKRIIVISIFVQDNSGVIKINKFFQGNSTHFYLKQYKGQFPEGSQVLCVGRVKLDKAGRNMIFQETAMEIISEDFNEEDRSSKINIAKIVPIYPLTQGLSLKHLRRLIFSSLQNYSDQLIEFIPEEFIESNQLMHYKEAIHEIHFPETIESKNNAVTRLLYEEFFLMQVKFSQLRYQHKKKNQGIKFNCFDNGLVDKFISCLPFELTSAQQRVFFNEILPDMVSKEPMHRLVQGDVGSGKTVVAFLSLLVAISDGYQGAVMVPTEILAEQHYKKFQEWVNMMQADLQIKVGILIGKQRTRDRKLVLDGLRNGTINIVVGTHALIQDSVEFANLGLIVIDEQHRFGVKQREKLSLKNNFKNKDTQISLGQDAVAHSISSPSVEKLFMTATPIPRTLALAMHGDLDMSEIDEMPVGRLPIITSVVKYKNDAHELIKEELDKGNQAYIVFPLIEESETLAAKAATVEYEKLSKGYFEEYSIGLIHGKLKDDIKESIMQDFRDGKIQILVSTTVIEVGVDVPNATVILIESSERFGLAQLHQLRGRVGRSDKQSYCLLSSGSRGENNLTRLNILCKSNNGFVVAQEDLKLRGAGEITGLRQSGLPDSVLEGLVDQEELLKLAREDARKLIIQDPEIAQHPALKARLARSYRTLNLNAG